MNKLTPSFGNIEDGLAMRDGVSGWVRERAPQSGGNNKAFSEKAEKRALGLWYPRHHVYKYSVSGRNMLYRNKRCSTDKRRVHGE